MRLPISNIFKYHHLHHMIQRNQYLLCLQTVYLDLLH
ncbi:hypothetical protein X975_20344, partial [Stegodyphus mimosarum]